MTRSSETTTSLIIECPSCQSRVAAEVLGEHWYYSDIADGAERTLLLNCPSCRIGLVGVQFQRLVDIEYDGTELMEWGKLVRVWPSPDRIASRLIPEAIRFSLQEAEKCYTATAYGACAVMCGRAMEELCRAFETRPGKLAKRLQELFDRKIIDEKLLTWGNELWKQRNIGAHEADTRIGRQDAMDLLDFAYAICDYAYVLTATFEEYLDRQSMKAGGTKEGRS